ncbi:MAG: DNA mismatch repair protein MutS [Bryobacterales bacterium]|nr:DNA mismatch repair protein MutS [Bryobacterales bacterium]
MAADSPTTPLMRQYHALKQQAPGALLMFHLGDFYELFYEDAVAASQALEITLTSRNKEKGEPVPMCGVPRHAAENYIARLVQKGYRVALCDQMEDPRAAKGLVKRDITRVVTPGTALGDNVLRARENNYLAAVALPAGKAAGEAAGVAYVDVSTGEFRATEMPAGDVAPFLESLSAREVLLAADDPAMPGVRTVQEPWTFDYDNGERSLRDHFRLLSLDGCGLGGRVQAVRAAGAVLQYLRETQRTALDHLDRPAFFERASAMMMDAVTVRNLELVEPLFAGESREVTLLSAVDRTVTGMGARLLRRRLLRPSIDRDEIEARLDAVEEMTRAAIQRGELRGTLSSMQDLERLLARVTLGAAGPKEMQALGRSLALVPELRRGLGPARAARLGGLRERMDEVACVRDAILGALADEAPAALNDGGFIRDGFDAALDGLRDISRNSKQYLARIEARERARTGIGSLKIRFNNVFGYYIEISKANSHLAPADYERKQTLVNAERFTTPELKELESKILDAEEKMIALEREVFVRLRAQAAAEAARIRETAAAVAELDVTCGLAETAVAGRYARPRFDASGVIRVEAGRHPVVECLAGREAQRFIPNDLFLDPGGKFLAVITGPNMGGKSTYLRQAALILILAQAGSFVPAGAALLPVVDRVFTRIGASDNLARGRSTFMVEMTETAAILSTATENSFLVLDEIGRGTATYDGLALAWAVVEFIHERIRAKTLFATHYHELTELAGRLDGVANLHVTVKEAGDRIIFLRRVEPGAAGRSFGIEVARLAGLPHSVVDRAKEVLAMHESVEHKAVADLTPREEALGPVQIQLFEPVGGQLAERIRQLKLDELRPIDALNLLSELQRELRGS